MAYHDCSPVNSSGFVNFTNSGAMEAIELDTSAGGGFLAGDPKRHDDLKEMLDSSKESLKLEAMKRIIGMVARGRDCADLFPAVVKNVVSKNIEIKKLVYVYLTRYAEEQQDLALLSISTFQRALKDPNQLIRASALRVLSSIRVPVIVPIMMLAIRDSAVDMSPFVRKTAAHAIPKLFSIDPEQKEELVGIIEKLLGDRTTLVVGSAVMAFEEVCPERIELIHKNYRKLNNLLVDVDEWGQVIILNMLLRYARSQFLDPNAGSENWESEVADTKDFYENDSDHDDSTKKSTSNYLKMDPDHRLLLKSAKPLLQSRNASVVMATAQLFHHCAPKPEIQVVAKAMVRLLRSHPEVQVIILNCIASMTSHKGSGSRSSMFEPYLRNFFIRSSDPAHVKILKLEVLTNLATAGNIGVVLREFQSYISSQDRACVAATIAAIGRCASAIEEITDACLRGLVILLSNRDQGVVAESVVVIKKLLQTQSGDHKDIIVHMAKLVDTIKIAEARAAILWVIGEYSDRVPKIAPDVLRKMAKTFISEEVQVKLQVLNLAAKLCLVNPKQTKLLTQYVLNLAKYDQNYDIRDRARFIRVFLFPAPGQENNKLIKHAKKIFLASKPAPVVESRFKDRDVFQLGSMSHFLNTRVPGYQDLPSFPQTAPDPSVRNIEPPRAPNTWAKSVTKHEEKSKKKESSSKKKEKKKKSFYSDEESVSGSGSGTSDSESSSSSSGSSSSESSFESSENDEPQKTNVRPTKPSKNSSELLHIEVQSIEIKASPESSKKHSSAKGVSDSESSSDESSSSSSESTSSDEDPKQVTKSKPNEIKKIVPAKKSAQSNLDLLLSLDEEPQTVGSQQTILSPMVGGMLTPANPPKTSVVGSSEGGVLEAPPVLVPTKTVEVLNKMTTSGLQVLYRFTRSPHLYSQFMCNVQLVLNNLGQEDISDLKIGSKNLAPGMSIHEFPGIASLPVGSSRTVSIGINFNDTTQPAKFDLVFSGRVHAITLIAPMGEIIRAVSMPENTFNAHLSKLRGMNETCVKFKLPSACSDAASISKKVFEVANVLQVPTLEEGDSSTVLKFSAQTLATKALVLITLKVGSDSSAELWINCEKMVIASMLAKEIQQFLQE